MEPREAAHASERTKRVSAEAGAKSGTAEEAAGRDADGNRQNNCMMKMQGCITSMPGGMMLNWDVL